MLVACGNPQEEGDQSDPTFLSKGDITDVEQIGEEISFLEIEGVRGICNLSYQHPVISIKPKGIQDQAMMVEIETAGSGDQGDQLLTTYLGINNPLHRERPNPKYSTKAESWSFYITRNPGEISDNSTAIFCWFMNP
jgi:hypothetical protein